MGYPTLLYWCKMKEGLISQIENLSRLILARAGIQLLEVELSPGKEPRVVFTIFKPGGVSIRDCEQATALLDEHIDQFFPGRYYLEVSSPGLNRELKRKEEYEIFKGREVRILLRRPLEEEDLLEGVLEGLQGEGVLLRKDEKVVEVPLELIQKTRLIFK